MVVGEFVNPEKYTKSFESTAVDSKCEKFVAEPVPDGLADIFHKCVPLVDNLKPTPQPTPRLLICVDVPVLLSLIYRSLELVFIDTYTPDADTDSETGNSDDQIASPDVPVIARDHKQAPALEYFTTKPSAPAVDTSDVPAWHLMNH